MVCSVVFNFERAFWLRENVRYDRDLSPKLKIELPEFASEVIPE